MSNAIVVTSEFDGYWPHAASHAQSSWAGQGPLTFIRIPPGAGRRVLDARLPAQTTRLLVLGAELTAECVASLPALVSVGMADPLPGDSPARRALAERGVGLHSPPSEGFWGQSVAEFALGLTIGALRRIPQTHCDIRSSHAPWDYAPAGGIGRPGERGHQFGDDRRFANGTIAGKRVRVVGLGNIGSRFASACAFLGADVAAWDTFAQESVFHRTNTRRLRTLAQAAVDAEIFAPMLPLREATRGLVDRATIDALPRGTLVVLVTRMEVCDVAALRRRVLADEIALAADVFDVEPLPIGDPLLGRANVVHTPHNAGRTVHANQSLIDAILAQFE